jgi:hypothetical protein
MLSRNLLKVPIVQNRLNKKEYWRKHFYCCKYGFGGFLNNMQDCNFYSFRQTCPVATNINLLELAENCIGLQRPHMAAIFIAYAKNEVKEKIINVSMVFIVRRYSLSVFT